MLAGMQKLLKALSKSFCCRSYKYRTQQQYPHIAKSTCGVVRTWEAPKGLELGEPKPKLLPPPKAGVEAAPKAGVLAPNAGADAPNAGCTFSTQTPCQSPCLGCPPESKSMWVPDLTVCAPNSPPPVLAPNGEAGCVTHTTKQVSNTQLRHAVAAVPVTRHTKRANLPKR